MTASHPLLTFHQASFSYGSRPIFRNLNLEVQVGDLIHIQGGNGCGKSTLLRCAAGLHALKSGSLRHSLVDQPQSDKTDPRNDFSFLSAEHNGLFLNLDALRNYEFWTSFMRLESDKSEWQQTLEFWGLKSSVHRNIPTHKFSTGMKRRLALAVFCQPKKKLWILDEPFNGLDESGCKQLNRQLASHLSTGGGALIAAHEHRYLSDLSGYKGLSWESLK